MNELSNNANYSEMQAELQALRKRLEDLETKQAAFKGATHPTVRRRFPKALSIASISLVALLVGSGLLWGVEPIKALFIDANGNVHMGGNTLEMRTVNGSLALQYKYKNDGGKHTHRIGFSDGVNPFMFWSEYESNNAYIGGKLGIGTDPDQNYALNVNSKAKVNGDLDLTGSGKLTATSANVTNSLKAGSANVTGLLEATSANVTGPLTATTTLTVDGNAQFNGMINGEKPPKAPIKFTIPITPKGVSDWNTDIRDIGNLCADGDGCRIVLLLKDGKETIRWTYEVYIDPSSGIGSATGSNGVRYQWKLGGPTIYRDTQIFKAFDNWAQAINFIPDPAAVVNHPFGSDWNRQPKNTAFRDKDKYLIAFQCHYTRECTFIIYDR